MAWGQGERVRLIRVLLLLWGLPWLVGCQGDEPAFKVGINRWLGYEPFLLAKHLDFYPDIDIVRLSSTLDVMRALRNGNLQAAGLTLDETLTLIDEGIELDIILVLDYSNGADLVTAHPDITNLQALEGKRIGVEMSAAGAFMLHAMLRQAGLSLQQVKIESMPISHLSEAYAAKRIDAAVSYQPHSRLLIEQGMRPLFSSADIPGQIVDVLAIRSDSAYRAKQIQQLIDGYFRTQRFIREHPDAALQRMSTDLGSTTVDLERDLQGIHWLSHDEAADVLFKNKDFEKTARRMMEVMRELGMLHRSHSPTDFIDSHWLEQYQP